MLGTINDELGWTKSAPISQGAVGQYERVPHNNFAGLVVSGIRRMPEVKYIHARGGKLIFVDASDELRLGRLQARSRDDLTTMTDMRQREYAELHGETAEGKNGIWIDGMRDNADVVITNNGALQDLQHLIDVVLESFRSNNP